MCLSKAYIFGGEKKKLFLLALYLSLMLRINLWPFLFSQKFFSFSGNMLV